MTEPQGTKTEAEGVVAPTQVEEKPTEKTRDEDFQRAVSKGLEKMQRQLDLQKAEANKYKAEAGKHEAAQKHSQAYIESLKKEMEKLSSSIDDEDVKKAYVGSMTSLEREMKIAEREADVETKLYEASLKEKNLGMAIRARALMDETGVPLDAIEDCQTEEEMEVKALRFSLANPKSEEEPEEETPKFDSTMPSGAGKRIYRRSELNTLQGQIAQLPIGERKKARKEISDAFAEKRVLIDK